MPKTDVTVSTRKVHPNKTFYPVYLDGFKCLGIICSQVPPLQVSQIQILLVMWIHSTKSAA